MTDHIARCRAIVKRAGQLIYGVHELDPKAVWAQLGNTKRWELQALVVALAGMLKPDAATHELHEWLRSLSVREKGDHPHIVTARGLAKLLPEDDDAN